MLCSLTLASYYWKLNLALLSILKDRGEAVPAALRQQLPALQEQRSLHQITAPSQNHGMVGIGGIFQEHLVPTPLLWPKTPSTTFGCSKPHSTWPSHPQLLQKICSCVSLPSSSVLMINPYPSKSICQTNLYLLNLLARMLWGTTSGALVKSIYMRSIGVSLLTDAIVSQLTRSGRNW